MAYSRTFSTLKTELKSHLEDDSTEYDSELPSIIARAQDRVQLDLNLNIFYTTQTGTILTSSSSISRPNTAITVKYVHLPNDNVFLEERDLAYCKSYTGTGTPKYFNDDDDDTLFIAPSSDADRNYDLRFMERLTALSDSNVSNWISINAGDLLFQASVVESESFLKDAAKKDDAEKDYQKLLPTVLMRVHHMAAAEYALPGKGR